MDTKPIPEEDRNSDAADWIQQHAFECLLWMCGMMKEHAQHIPKKELFFHREVADHSLPKVCLKSEYKVWQFYLKLHYMIVWRHLYLRKGNWKTNSLLLFQPKLCLPHEELLKLAGVRAQRNQQNTMNGTSAFRMFHFRTSCGLLLCSLSSLGMVECSLMLTWNWKLFIQIFRSVRFSTASIHNPSRQLWTWYV